MGRWRFKSLGIRMMVPILVLTSLLLSGLGIIMLKRNNENSQALMISKGEALINLLEEISVPYIVNYDYPSLDSFVKQAIRDQEVAFLVFYDTKGKSLTTNSKESPDTSGQMLFERQIKDPESKVTLGLVKMGFSQENLKRLAQKELGIITGTLLLGLLLMGLGVGLIIRSITRPLKQIILGVSEGADGVAAAASEMSTTSNSLAQGASQQAATLEETTSSLEEMASMSRSNAANAKEADSLMGETARVVEKANNSMTDLTSSMGEVSTASQETAKIVKTIDEIAFQTNLLALNAAVEAARAGEAGAGFAVVADEVRALALRAAEAARNTADLIETTMSKVNQGVTLVDQTASAFRQVTDGAGKVKELVSEIAAASGEQAQGVEQINRAVQEMNQVVQNVAANAEESSSASEELHAHSEQMKGVVVDLVDLVGSQAGRNGHHKKDRTQRLMAPEERNAPPPSPVRPGRRLLELPGEDF